MNTKLVEKENNIDVIESEANICEKFGRAVQLAAMNTNNLSVKTFLVFTEGKCYAINEDTGKRIPKTTTRFKKEDGDLFWSNTYIRLSRMTAFFLMLQTQNMFVTRFRYIPATNYEPSYMLMNIVSRRDYSRFTYRYDLGKLEALTVCKRI